MADSTYDAAHVLMNRGLNHAYGYGYGGGVGNFGGDGSAVKESVRGNRDLALLESVNRTSTDAALSAQIERGDANIRDLVNTENQATRDLIQLNTLNDRFASIERMMNANQADTQRDISGLTKSFAECCCELKAGQASITAKLDAQALQAAQNEAAQLRQQIVIMQGQAQGGRV